MKEIFFLSGLPRAGNTLFGSLMNQNPDVAVTANSITADTMGELFRLKQYVQLLDEDDITHKRIQYPI